MGEHQDLGQGEPSGAPLLAFATRDRKVVVVLQGNLGMSRVHGTWAYGLGLALKTDPDAAFEDVLAEETRLLFESARNALHATLLSDGAKTETRRGNGRGFHKKKPGG